MCGRIVVYTPQVWENYTLQSGRGLSVLFVLIWLVGDVFSLAGGLIAQLVPTAIILATYVSFMNLIRQIVRRTPLPQYVFCDTLLLLQIYYYRWKNPHADEAPLHGREPSEDTPLLENPIKFKRTSCWSMENEVFRCSLNLVFVFVAGTIAWAIDLKIRGHSIPKEPEGILEWRSQILGWVSAVLFRASSTVFNFAFCFTHSRHRSSGRPYTTNL